MPPRSSSPICERSLDLTLIGIGRRDIPQCSSKHFHMEAFYRTFSGGQRPRSLTLKNEVEQIGRYLKAREELVRHGLCEGYSPASQGRERPLPADSGCGTAPPCTQAGPPGHRGSVWYRICPVSYTH